MNGVLVVDKPLGPTSHDVVARVRRALREPRIGHTGTLDPLATGVLPLVVGKATRLASLLSATEKEYVADIRLGAATDTYDAEGRILYDRRTGAVTFSGPAPAPPEDVARGDVERALSAFRGTFRQLPPAFSAKKSEGVAAFRRARRSQAVVPEPVTVTVSELVLESYRDGLARVRVTASAGFYVRSLAHDVGQLLCCGAHLEGLRRTKAAGFGLDDAVPLDAIEADPSVAANRLVELDRMLPALPAAVVTERGARRAAHGNSVSAEDFRGIQLGGRTGRVRVVDASGTLLAIAEARHGLLHPVIVLV